MIRVKTSVRELVESAKIKIDNLEVLNQLGQRVLAIDGSLLTNKQLNISSLESGLYFIRLTANNKTEILQVIKQ